MKYWFIRAHQGQFRATACCRVLRVRRGGYCEWRDRRPSARAQADARLLIEIERVHLAHFEAFGALKTWGGQRFGTKSRTGLAAPWGERFDSQG